METFPTLEKEAVTPWAAILFAMRRITSFSGRGTRRRGTLCSSAHRAFIRSLILSAVRFSRKLRLTSFRTASRLSSPLLKS